QFLHSFYERRSSLAVLMDQLARHVGGRSKYRRLFASDFGARLLMAVPSLEAARYRACVSRRACIRSAAGTASSAITKRSKLQSRALAAFVKMDNLQRRSMSADSSAV